MLEAQLAMRFTWATTALKSVELHACQGWHVRKTLIPRNNEATCALEKGQAG